MSCIKFVVIILKALSKMLLGYKSFWSFFLIIYIYNSKTNFSQKLLKHLKSYFKSSNVTLRYQSNED